MEAKHSSIERLEKLTSESKYAEATFNLFKAVLSSVPAGGAITSLLTDYMTASRFNRVETFANHLAEDLRTFQNDVNENFIRTDEFAYAFEKCFRGTVENYQQEKLDAFRNILINSLIKADFSAEEKEYFIYLVENLSSLHLELVKITINAEEDEKGKFWMELPGVDINITESSYKDLVRYGLLSGQDRYAHPDETDSKIMFYGKPTLTTLGNRFVNFCLTRDA
jgi:hypothetical protein